MSGKFEIKKKRNGKRGILWGGILLLAVVLIAVIVLGRDPSVKQAVEAIDSAQEQSPETVPTEENMIKTKDFSPVTLGNGLTIMDIGKYTGIFMEDGTDEVVSGILMLVVKNTGEQDIQYAEISLVTDNCEAMFALTTLPVGETCVLLEQNRMGYTGKEDASRATVSNVAVFQEPLGLQEEILQLQVLDGALNVTNISGQDITGNVTIYYKNAASNMFYGGITYRVRIEGGIKAGEIKQIMASHFSDTGSKIVFVTVN